jgi:DNA-binding transcriptional ArsR family regulator
MTSSRRPGGKSNSGKVRRGEGRPATGPAATGGEPPPRRLLITDPQAIRALAHPLRVSLLEAIRRDGEITATRAAELLGESPGNMSWHLQTLAKYGFLEEAEGRGRIRPWRLTSPSRSFETGMATDPDTAAAAEALERTVLARTYDQMREWWSRRFTYPVKWRSAAFVTDTVRYLTAEELTSIMDEITAIYDRFAGREDQERRPDDALPVHLHSHGHPLTPTPSGN